MDIKIFTFNPFQENTYLIYDNTNECIVIDAGCYEQYEQTELVNFIEKNNLKLKKIINTHCHIDHILGVKFLKEKYNVDFIAGKNDEFLLNMAVDHAKIYGFKTQTPPLPDLYTDNLPDINFGNTTLDILNVPGHTPGHVAYYCKAENCVFTGDVLFKGSIGRTDLPGGNYDTLISSIYEKLLTLPEDCIVYSGHGDSTSIGFEKNNNPFLGN